MDLDRYYKKLSDYNNESLPYPFVLHDAEYTDEISKSPEILNGNVWGTFGASCLCIYTRAMLVFKILKAYNYYQSGFVHTIFYYPVSNSSKCCILKGKVAHGQRHSDPPVTVWILTNKDDCKIKAAHCT